MKWSPRGWCVSPGPGAVACTIFLLLAGCSGESGSEVDGNRAQAPTVTGLTVASRPFASSIEFIGATQAYRKVDLRARVTGYLDQQAFAEGGQVDEGDLLFRIDASEFDAALAAAQAGLERAEATLQEAGRSLSRSQELAGQGTISQATLDEAVAAETRARADVSAAEADVAQAELNLSYTQIHSPISGRIGKSAVDVGNLVGADSGVLATVVTLDPIRVVFSVAERLFLEVSKSHQSGNAEAFIPRIKLANGEFHEHQGEFRFGDNQVDPSTGTIRIFLEFPNPDKLLVPGLFVTVVMSSEEETQRILVPQAAVQLNQSGSFVLVVDGDSRVQMRQIETGDRSGADVVVDSGLEAGETIVVEGIQKVRPGGVVTLVPAAAQAAPQ